MKSVKSAEPFGVDVLSLIESRGHLGAWSWDVATQVTHWSAGLFRLLGLDPAETAPGLAALEQKIHPDDRLAFADPRPLLESGLLADRRFRLVEPDGRLRWMHGFARLLAGESGRPPCVIGVVFDESDMRRGREAVELQARLLGAIEQLFDVTIWRCGADGQAIEQEDWWRSNDPLRPGGWSRIYSVHPDDRVGVREAWARAIRDGRRYSASYRVEWNGSPLRVVSRAVSLCNAEGRVEGWLGVTALSNAPTEISEAISRGAPGDMLTPALVRAARAMLGWSASELADHAKVSFSTVRRAEAEGVRRLRGQSLGAIRTAFEKAGIRFVVDAGGRVGIVAA